MKHNKSTVLIVKYELNTHNLLAQLQFALASLPAGDILVEFSTEGISFMDCPDSMQQKLSDPTVTEIPSTYFSKCIRFNKKFFSSINSDSYKKLSFVMAKSLMKIPSSISNTTKFSMRLMQDKNNKYKLIKEATCDHEIAEYRRELCLSESLEKHILYDLFDQKLLCEFDSQLPWIIVGNATYSNILYDQASKTLYVRNPNMINKVKSFKEDECSRLDINGLYFSSEILKSITKLYKKFHICTTKLYYTKTQLIATVGKANTLDEIAEAYSFSCMTTLVTRETYLTQNSHLGKKESSLPFREIIKKAEDASIYLKKDPHVEIAKNEEENDDHKANSLPEEPEPENMEYDEIHGAVTSEEYFIDEKTFYAAAPKHI
jgi:hypothetical protein